MIVTRPLRMVGVYCIVLANLAIDFVEGQLSFFVRPAIADKAFVECPLALPLH
jgi:hypothetical protein